MQPSKGRQQIKMLKATNAGQKTYQKKKGFLKVCQKK